MLDFIGWRCAGESGVQILQTASNSRSQNPQKQVQNQYSAIDSGLSSLSVDTD